MKALAGAVARVVHTIAGWRDSQPVRLYVWPALLAIAGAIVADGLSSSSTVNTVLDILAFALGVPAVEVARNAVTAPSSLNGLINSLLNRVERDLADRIGPENAKAIVDRSRLSKGGCG